MKYFVIASLGIILSACSGGSRQDNTTEKKIGTDLSFSELLLPLPREAILSNKDYHIWCGSMIRTNDGICHLFYSRWPMAYSHLAWVSHSEIAYAVADNPLGPYTHVNVALPPRGKEYWDGLMTHNPTIHKFGDKYYLYYVGNTGDQKITPKLNHIHRNNQRIGVATADHPAGPWTRYDKPLVDVTQDKNATDALLVTNPAIAMKPEGGFLMIYKAAAIDSTKDNLGGKVVHRVAYADNPDGPFTKLPGLVFEAEESEFPAEDPYIWFQDDRYLAIVKDMHGAFTSEGTALLLFESFDGMDWSLCSKPLVSRIELNWEDGVKERIHRLERPQLFFENGKPAVLFVSAAYSDSHSFNVHIPLNTNY